MSLLHSLFLDVQRYPLPQTDLCPPKGIVLVPVYPRGLYPVWSLYIIVNRAGILILAGECLVSALPQSVTPSWSRASQAGRGLMSFHLYHTAGHVLLSQTVYEP